MDMVNSNAPVIDTDKDAPSAADYDPTLDTKKERGESVEFTGVSFVNTKLSFSERNPPDVSFALVGSVA
jgi:hypothetical protein